MHEESSEERLQSEEHQMFAKERLNKPDAFWKQVLWTDEVTIKLFGCNEQRYVWRKKVQNFMKRTPLQLLSTGWINHVLALCCGTVNISLVEGRMNSIRYHQILEAKYHTLWKTG